MADLDNTKPAVTFTCPASCTAGTVATVATGVYALTTPLCQAAVHAGMLTTAGGTITVYHTLHESASAFQFTAPGGYFFRLDIPVNSLLCDDSNTLCGMGRYARTETSSHRGLLVCLHHLAAMQHAQHRLPVPPAVQLCAD